jgi:hypothetical protein
MNKSNPVAVTRAREAMTLVSSFAHTDIDTTKVRDGIGLEFLRNYLQYAASNGTVFAHGEISNEPMNDFEADIEALTARGLKLVPQVGCSSFRIGFGVCHPSDPAALCLQLRVTVRLITPAARHETEIACDSRC